MNASVPLFEKLERKKHTRVRSGSRAVGEAGGRAQHALEGRPGGESEPKRRGGGPLSSAHCFMNFSLRSELHRPALLSNVSLLAHTVLQWHGYLRLHILLLVANGFSPRPLYLDTFTCPALAVDLISFLSFPG